jgi:lysophospholipase L1-like esterase
MNYLIRRTVGAFKVMSVIESLTGISNCTGSEGRAKTILPFDTSPGDCREVLSRDVLHCDVKSTLGFTQVVNLDDVRVSELSTHSRFVLKHANESFFFRKMAKNFLDDDEAIKTGQPRLPGKPNLRHPAGSEFLEEREATKLLHWSDRRSVGFLGRGARHAAYAATLPSNTPDRKLLTAENLFSLLGFVLVLCLSNLARAAGPTSPKALAALQKKLKISEVPIENPCVVDGVDCQRKALSRVFAKLKAVKSSKNPVRILHLGDSHIAADYISGPIRRRLQSKFGDAGRGFMHIDHRRKYGGRVINRKEGPWKKLRHVELHKKHLEFGFSGISLESRSRKASISYRLSQSDSLVRLYYQQQPKGGVLQIRVGGKSLGPLDTKGPKKSVVAQFQLPKLSKKKARLILQALGPKVKLYGISFETSQSGVLFDPIGPVGADAKLYTEFGQDSFRQHLQAYSPDLIILMVGGNDAMKIRKGWTTLEKVKQDHLQFLSTVRKVVPNADCMIWSPMDAGRRKGKRIVSQWKIHEVARLQAAVAKSAGCAFWDLYGFMGEKGSIARWSRAGVMNRDLIHPKRAAADLIGTSFADFFLEAYRKE